MHCISDFLPRKRFHRKGRTNFAGSSPSLVPISGSILKGLGTRRKALESKADPAASFFRESCAIPPSIYWAELGRNQSVKGEDKASQTRGRSRTGTSKGPQSSFQHQHEATKQEAATHQRGRSINVNLGRWANINISPIITRRSRKQRTLGDAGCIT